MSGMASEVCREGGCEADFGLRVRYCTPNFAAKLGYDSPEEVIGKKPLRGVDMENELNAEGIYAGPAVLLDRHNLAHYVDVHIHRIDDGYLLDDIIVLSTADTEFWERMFRTMPIPVMLLSKEHIIVDLNDAMANLVSKKREELVGTKCYTLMHNTEAPPDGCPLEDANAAGLPHALNIMDTVLGKFLISVAKIDDNLYAHYSIREAAVLVDIQGRMMDLLRRYNRILLAATAINEEIIKRRDIMDIVKSIEQKTSEIEGFIGVGIFFYNGDRLERYSSTGTMITAEELMPVLEDSGVKKVEINGSNYYIFRMKDSTYRGAFVLNVGEDDLSDDEMRTIKSTIDRFGEYMIARKLEEKRERAYEYINEVMQDFAELVDKIRNPLATILATAEVEIEDPKLRDAIISKVEEIQFITRKIDEVWTKAESMRKYLDTQ